MSNDDTQPDETAGGKVADPLGLDDHGGGPADPPPPARRGGRGLGVVAVLLALIALAGAGYVYYEVIERGDVPGLADRVAQLRAELEGVTERFTAEQQAQVERREAALEELRDRQRAALAELREEQRAALAALREDRDAALQASEAALRRALADVSLQTPPDAEVWRQAEARYLLRIASHRLDLERDVSGALRLLRRADAVLAELDNPAWHDVRLSLAEDINALENVGGADLTGLFARLEALKSDLSELPGREPRYRQPQPDPEPAAADHGLWAALTEQLSGLLRIRRLDGEAKPLLAPEEAVYLELNLRLMLERAQLAAMRGEQTLFEQSLDEAVDWIREYLNADQPPLPAMLEALSALRQVELRQSLPDISGSLEAMQRAAAAAEAPP